ncbi:hypothetical protein O3W44_23660 [Pantoea sp. LMR881]|uniref:hypothetical protein n=1 Tax=Pantoea sp. LMR881 TaxID=3014336 RepID=UPI0022B013A8|nr:hypothetical protein [Pantoea sp. LMR881]MCZ4061492.1 hypothetical protein [Pantoea sp. LMR881]
MQDDSQRQYTPYIRTNYYHGWGGTAKVKVGSADSDSNQRFESGKFGQMWDVGIGGTTRFKMMFRSTLKLITAKKLTETARKAGVTMQGYAGHFKRALDKPPLRRIMNCTVQPYNS